MTSLRLRSREFIGGLLAGSVLTAAVTAGAWAVLDDSSVGTDGSAAASSADARSDNSAESTPSEAPTIVDDGDDSSDEDSDSGEEDTTEAPTPAPAAVQGSGRAATALPNGDPVRCPDATVDVADAAELTDALAGARPGDTIGLAAGTYVGAFVTTASGTEADPIFLCGEPDAVLDGEEIDDGYVLHLNGATHWRLVGFTVRNGQKGVVADGTTGTVIQGLTVENIGDEAIHLRTHSTGNAVLDNTVRNTGLRRDKFGEGVYVGSAVSNWETYTDGQPDESDLNLVQGNTISDTGSESVDIKEGSTGGAVLDNVFDGSGMTGADSWVDIKGNDWLIQGNTGTNAPEDGYQTHRILDGWGSGNVFRGNSASGVGDGVDFYIHDPEVTANVVSCDNRGEGGGRPTANVDCTP